MKKKIISLFLILVCIFTISGCTKQENPTPDPKPNVPTKWDGTTPYTDQLKLTVDYEGKDYYDDGIGVVQVVQYVDGDTTIFKTKNGHSITIRYEGIDTPESTYTVEPWGFAASKHTKETLKNAKKIVLQTDNGKPGKENADSTGKRYMAWVWADGRLLNLELVEIGLAKSKAAGTSLASTFSNAMKAVFTAKERVYGQNNDPDYDYSNEYTSMSLKEIVTKYTTADAVNKELDKGKKVQVSGTICRRQGVTSAYLQQVGTDKETGEVECYGIYLYGGFNENNRLGVGYSVIINGTIGYYNGQVQITDVSTRNVKVQSFSNFDSIIINEPNDIKEYINNSNNIGNLVKLNTEIKITSAYDAAETNAFSLRASYVDKNGNTQSLSIRVDKNTTLKDPITGDRITSGDYFVGKTLKSLTGIIGYYDPTQNDIHDGYVQILLVSSSDYEILA